LDFFWIAHCGLFLVWFRLSQDWEFSKVEFQGTERIQSTVIPESNKKKGLVTSPLGLLELDFDVPKHSSDDVLEFFRVAEGRLVHIVHDLLDLVGQIEVIDSGLDSVRNLAFDFVIAVGLRAVIVIVKVGFDSVVDVILTDEVIGIDTLNLINLFLHPFFQGVNLVIKVLDAIGEFLVLLFEQGEFIDQRVQTQQFHNQFFHIGFLFLVFGIPLPRFLGFTESRLRKSERGLSHPASTIKRLFTFYSRSFINGLYAVALLIPFISFSWFIIL